MKQPCPFHKKCFAPCPIEAGVLREIPFWHVEGRSRQHNAGKVGAATTNKGKTPRLHLVPPLPKFTLKKR